MTAVARIRPDRPIDGVAALLLPHTAEGRPDLGSFTELLVRTYDAGLTPAVNMDTGFGPEIGPSGRSTVLGVTSEIAAGRRFVAGAMPFGHDGEAKEAYRAEVAAIVDAGGTPIVFPSGAVASLDGPALASFVEDVVAGAPEALAFELGTMFAPFGRIFDLDTVRRLMAIVNLTGMKHSSLDRLLEWDRLALRDAERPDFRIYTGNDLAIDMVMWGSDYLLGLASFDVDAFALRDRLWADGDPRFFQLNDALQAVGRVAFRPPVPAYKHSCSIYLRLSGRLLDPHPHPEAPQRAGWEADVLRPLADAVRAAVDAAGGAS